MTGFKFRLAKILEHRETLENIKKGEFGKIQSKLKSEKDKLAELENIRDDIARQKEETSIKTTTINELQMYNNFIADLNKKIKLQEKNIEDTKMELEKIRKELIEATKDKKIIEKLKLRDYQEHLYQEKKEEEKINDQFVSYSSSTNVMGD